MTKRRTGSMIRAGAVLMAALCVCSLARAEESIAAVVERANAFLILDYLPSAIYEGDPLTVCFRVENASKNEAAFEVTGRAFDSGGKELKAVVEKAAPKPGAFESVTLEFGSQRAASVQVEMKRGAAVVAKTGIKFVRASDAWPVTQAINGRMADAASGDLLVLVVQKKRVVEERAFAPFKWVFGKEKAPQSSSSAAFFAPGAWKINSARLVILDPIGPFKADSTPPILKAMDVIQRELKVVKSTCPISPVVVVLPPEDLSFATEPRAYHVLLEAMLERLGNKEVILFAPFKYGCNETHRKALWREIHAVASLYSARVIDPVDWMDESVWLVDSAAPGVFASVPNDAGKKMIEQALSVLIK